MGQPDKPLRILMLEDEASDAELAEITLRENGLDFTCKRVDTENDFQRALEDFSPSIVLADYRLPAYSGRDALEYCCSTFPHIPVIILTGALGDEAAVDLVKLGARDYVLKNNKERLALSIHRVLAETEILRRQNLAEENVKSSETRYRRLFESAKEGLLILDAASGKIEDANPCMLDLLSARLEEVTGKLLWEIGLFVNVEHYEQGFRQFHSQESVRFDVLPLIPVCGGRFEVEFVGTLYQAGDRKLIHCSIRDVTVRIHSEKTLATQARALRLLSRCSSLLMHADEEHLLLDGICRLAVETGGYMMAWVGFAEHDAAKTVRPVAYSGYEQGYLDTLRISWADTELGHGPSGIAIRTGRTAINQNCLTDPKMWPWHAAMIKRGYQSFIALPLTRSGKTYGALAIYSADPFAFVKEEVDLLEELVKELSFGINTLRARIENEQKATILKQSLEQSIKAIANTFESRETSTVGHQRRVADLARAIACEMCLPEEQVIGLHLAATIHDSGKIEVPTEILSKTGKLTESEFMLIKTHAQAGYDILKGVQFPWPVADIILQHHERLDGSGYPQGLKEEQILLEAKIIAVADVVEAISTDRSYRPSLGIEAALEEVERYRGVRYDPKAVDACLRLFRELGYTLPA